MKLKKKTVIILVVIAVIGILIGITVGSYNGMVDKQQAVEKSASQISTYMQARADKIPNLVAVVKDYGNYEQETLTAVIEARNSVKKATTPNEQVAAAEDLNSSLDVWVNALTEAYPNLKSNEHYTVLMDELSGSENRIAIARKDYNDAVKDYNTSIKKFPRNIFASIFGFDSYEYFEAAAGAETVPDVGGLLSK